MKSQGAKNQKHTNKETQEGDTGWHHRGRQQDLTNTKTTHRHTNEAIRYRWWSEAGKRTGEGKEQEEHRKEEVKSKTQHMRATLSK